MPKTPEGEVEIIVMLSYYRSVETYVDGLLGGLYYDLGDSVLPARSAA